MWIVVFALAFRKGQLSFELPLLLGLRVDLSCMSTLSTHTQVSFINVVPVIVTSQRSVGPSFSKGEQCAAAVPHQRIIGWSNPQIPTPNTECQARRQQGPFFTVFWSSRGSNPQPTSFKADTLPLDQWAGLYWNTDSMETMLWYFGL